MADDAKRLLSYQEAIDKSLTVEWRVETCKEGEKCWCRIIKPTDPILFDDRGETEYWIIRPGEINRNTVEHLVKVHNNSLGF